MKKSNLIHILRACSKKEIRELAKWLHSPVHNQREDVIKLHNFLMEDDHLLKDDFLGKEYVYRWIFPEEPYNDGKMRQVIYFMRKSVDEFLVYNELMSDDIRAKIVLGKVYRKKKLYKVFERNTKVLEKIKENYPYRNADFLRNEYSWLSELYAYESERKVRSASFNLQEASDSLDVVYLADKLRQSCLMLAHETVTESEYEIGLLEEVLDYVEKSDLLKFPAIAIYYYGYKSITEPENEVHFDNLKKEVLTSDSFFFKTEMRDIYLMTVNYCIGKMNKGDSKFIREAFELYKRGFETGIYIENGIVSRWTFQNLVLIGLSLKEYSWIENFIHKYKDIVDKAYRESIVNFCYAKLYYTKGDFDRAKDHLLFVNYTDALINLRAKIILMKMYFEEKEIEPLESLLGSMGIYVQRKEVSAFHKVNSKNIIRLTKKLLRVVSQKQRAKLKLEIETVNPLSEREWLLGQLEKIR